MDNPLQSAIQKMGSNFLVAAFVPALAFVVATYFIFRPIFQSLFQPQVNSIETGIVLLLLATILGFTLYTIYTYVYKAFEGYVFVLASPTKLRSSFLKRQKRRYRNIVTERQQVVRFLKRVNHKLDYAIKHPTFTKWYSNRLNRLVAQKQILLKRQYNLTSRLEYSFPPSENLIMPTRFGNVLKAAEMYPKRYGIDSVPLWSRLACVMPSQDGGMMEKINEANNQCQFLLNGVLLATLFSFACLGAAMYESFLWLYHYESGRLAITYFILAFVSVTIAWFFYEASLLNVGQFGGMIRASYDLYRFDLLKALHLELPKTLKEEKKIWLKVSHIVTGNMNYKESDLILDDTIDQVYSHPKNQITS